MKRKKQAAVPRAKTVFVKHDQQKPRFSLIPPDTIKGVMAVLEHGAAKYDADNWCKCTEPIRYYDAAMRHILAWKCGEKLDTESGLPHLHHALCCLIFLSELDGRDGKG